MSVMKFVDLSHSDLRPKYVTGIGGRKYRRNHDQRIPMRHTQLSEDLHEIYKHVTILAVSMNPLWRKSIIKKHKQNKENGVVGLLQEIRSKGYTHIVVDDYLRDIIAQYEGYDVPKLFHESEVEPLLKFKREL